ncbi:murein hydrolase activator EnvC family protein [Methylophaga muralis]|uniref:Murein hydrolase activator EnvC n=1 Tax=Methylophaga muralis TaxID=291169 RepID=A0A1E3GWB9_9GAMM|nr:peptidoglycan DD-metalloendopeptidase family protein [Methylophaga muralis]ODN68343.1 Murein hydrolase activator EnvC precursor [Methylophaga muralis]
MIRGLILFLWLFLPLNLAAEPSSAKKLEAVRGEISTLDKNLNLNKKTQAELQQQLKKQSLKVSEINRELNKLKQSIAVKDDELLNLQLEQGQTEQQQAQQLEALNEQIRSAFMNAQPSYLKILLSEQSPERVSRSNTYYRYFHTARQQQIEALQTTLLNLTEQEKAIYAVKKNLGDLEQQQLAQQEALKQQTAERESTLAALNKKISGQDAQLSALRQEEKDLQSLLNALAKKAAQRPPPAAAVKPNARFSGLSGKLQWPLTGKILASYGSQRNLDKLSWKGILIASDKGTSVKASADGRVVFADWMKGFGLLIIIDHGEQFMTLYGNNDSLLKNTGDTVKAGDVIAQSGDQGVRQIAGLYFEVRHKGSPTNPIQWLRKQG